MARQPHGMLIEPPALAAMIAAKECVVFDCRFDLQHPRAGYHSWLAAHIPGAVYADTDKHLAGPVTARSGRHPLPASRSFASFLAQSGWRKGMTAVAYDAHGGAFAARFWWLMKYFGLGNTLLLNGGINEWMKATLPLEFGESRVARQTLETLEPRKELVLKTPEIVERLPSGAIVLVDARDRLRFEGESEPVDSVAGHIPGALSHPFGLNLNTDKRFRSPQELKSGFNRLAAKSSPAQLVHMCGSGVTACHNIFAMELAGLGESSLYAGSWSEWIRDPGRPVALGPA